MMDLDRFKSVNDTVGHQRGDDVLRDVAEVLRRCSRESDFAARYGGEEFTMILPHADVDEARRVAERIRGQVADLSAIEPGLSVTVSVGIAAFPHHAADTDGILGCGRRRAARRQGARSQLRLHLRRRRTRRAGRAADAAGRSRPPLRPAGRSVGGRGRRSGRRPAGPRDRSGQRRPAGRRRRPRRRAASPVDHLFAALLYGTERWDGAGYPEGLRGESIPRVARAFAVLRAYARDGAGGASLRAEAGRRFDPRMVNRFLAFLGEEASHWNPLDGVAGGRG